MERPKMKFYRGLMIALPISLAIWDAIIFGARAALFSGAYVPVVTNYFPTPGDMQSSTGSYPLAAQFSRNVSFGSVVQIQVVSNFKGTMTFTQADIGGALIISGGNTLEIQIAGNYECFEEVYVLATANSISGWQGIASPSTWSFSVIPFGC